MTFNIRYGTADDGENRWELRRELAIDVLRDHAPHIVGLQEALHFQIEEMLAALPRYAMVGVGRDDGREAGEYAPILYDTARLELLEKDWFWFSDSPSVPGSTSWGNTIPRIATHARLRDRVADVSFSVYNVHWDHASQPSRERSALLLLARIGARTDPAEPVIVMGDFNAGESNPAFTTLVSPPSLLRDTFRAVAPDVGGVGTFHGFRGGVEGEKIDAILVQGFAVIASEIDRRGGPGAWPSDHYPVTATLLVR